ncbi:glycosyltransferase [Streptomyces chiangmaiensis]
MHVLRLDPSQIRTSLPPNDIVDRQRFWAHRADRLIAISNATADDMVSLLHVPRSKITVIHLGTHVPAQQERKNPEDYLLYVGTRDRYKNWSIVVEALCARELSDLRLICCGGEPRRRRKHSC